MNKILSTIALAVIGLFLALPASATVPANPDVPWGTINVQTPSGGNATCTGFATSPVCILNLTGNLSGTLTISGTPATANGAYATLIFMQDGTGSRTFTPPANLVASTSVPTLPAIPSAANAWTVWVVQKVGTNYQVVGTYDNLPLSGTFLTTQTTNGTGVAPGASQAQPTVVLPGMTASSTCSCQAQTLPATWLTGITLACLPQTNAVQCVELNGTAGTITPTVVTLTVTWPFNF